MWRLFRTAAIWLLAFAIPFHGVAAAAMLNCGTGHHGRASAAESMAAASQVLSSMDEHAMHQHHHAHMAGGHGEHMPASDDIAQPPAQDDTADSSLASPDAGKHAQHKCSACASCGAPAVLPAHATFQPQRVPSAYVALPLFASAKFLTGGLDRPPRPLLA
jgi:hypothetical protein